MAASKWTEVHLQDPVPRSSHSVSITGGSALLYGGEISPREPVDSAVRVIKLGDGTVKTYDIGGAAASDSSPIPRVSQATTILQGKLFMFSGRGGLAMSPIEENGGFWMYDINDSKWKLLKPADSHAPFPEGRSYHAITNDGADTIYLHAGCPEKGRLQDLWSFSINNRAWKQLADAPGPARGGPSIAFSNDKVYRMNGFDGKTEQGGSLDVYDIASDSWTAISFHPDGQSGPIARSVCCLLSLKISGRPSLVTMFGESDPSNLGHQGAGKMLDDIWVFDTTTSIWSKLKLSSSSRPPARGWFDADVLQTGPRDRIVVQGGLAESNQRLGDLWILDFDE